jgi:raffinose/stachyose/melibiose transport system substrate-binding protein
MRKVIVLAVSLLLVVASFSFATASSEEEGVIVVDAMGYGNESNQEGVTWRRIVDAFEAANPNIDIQDELLYDENYHQKVTARLASGDVPDFAYMGADARWGAPWAEAGEQFDHTPYIDWSYYDRDLIPPMGPNGEIWEIPLGTSNMCTVLFMNEGLVNELGFDAPETYEDIVAMVPAAQAEGIDVISIDGADGWAWGSCVMSMVIARMSGDPNWVSKAVAGENSFTDEEFVESLAFLERMVDDGVIDDKCLLVDYGANVSAYSNRQALFMIQGQWVAGDIGLDVQEETVMMAWPELPGQAAGVDNSMAAAISVGYGVTQSGAADPEVRDAALAFINYFYSEAEVTQRLRDGGIVAPVLLGYQPPNDLPGVVLQKVGLAQSVIYTDVIDAFLSGQPNDTLNAGMQSIVAGDKTPAEVAAEVQALLDN